MKKLFFLFTLSLLMIGMAWGQGLEDFTNSNATASYQASSFIGNNGVTWSYVNSRDANNDANDSGIDLPALMLKTNTSNITSSSVAGGMGSFSVKLYKGFTGSGNRQVELFVNGVSKGTSATFDDYNEHIFEINDINTAGDVVIKIANVTTKQVIIDDITWTGFSSGENLPPSITGINITPSTDITSSTDVTVSATITDAEGSVAGAAVYWGTTSGERTNDVEMTNSSGDTWTAVIPAQANGTTVYYSVYALDNEAAEKESAEQSYTVTDPLTTTIPYSEDFSSGLTGVYTYTVTGTKPWTIYGDAAQCNGYGSSAEEQWMVLPGINFNNYTGERMSFATDAVYGTIDANNYLKLMYSSDYFGLGDPSFATWTEIPFSNGGVSGGVSPSGVLDLSTISGDMVYLAFKYYSTNSPTRWNVDDISIYLATPTITVNANMDAFTYEHNAGPSAEQSFTVSGADLSNDIVITAPSSYEISPTTGESFTATSPITLTQSSGSVAETTIYVRLKAGLAIGSYDQDITISSTGATERTVSLSGEVLTPAAPAAPVATSATATDSDSFIANWEAVSGATGYYIDVYEKEEGAAASDLFISEYIEGGSYNKAIEIYNGTSALVDLSSYSLKKQTNGAGEFGSELILSGTLATGAVYITGHSNAGEVIINLADNTNSTLVNFNGNDAVALFKNGVMIDVVGVIDQIDNWGSNVTLVRNEDASVPSTTYNTGDWDSYASDTFTYLGSHVFSGGSILTYKLENIDAGNVLSYEVTGLNPETTYYYVVRAYDAYSQTGTNSNEIEVTTPADISYDIVPGNPFAIDTNTNITGSGTGFVGATVEAGDLPPVPNAGNFEIESSGIINLVGTGSVTLHFDF
ncbi:MAG: lamin tail domain-containing protein, partial [Synergistaceae bacterium]